MARFSDTFDNQIGVPIAGASVYVVVSSTGALASLKDDSGNPLPQPLLTAANGTYYFNDDPNLYDLTFRYGGRVIKEITGLNVGNYLPSVSTDAVTIFMTAWLDSLPTAPPASSQQWWNDSGIPALTP